MQVSYKGKFIFFKLALGVKLTFFSDSHLAPKFFKVVANSKKSWSPFSKTNKIFLYPVRVLDRPSKIKGLVRN